MRTPGGSGTVAPLGASAFTTGPPPPAPCSIFPASHRVASGTRRSRATVRIVNNTNANSANTSIDGRCLIEVFPADGPPVLIPVKEPQLRPDGATGVALVAGTIHVGRTITEHTSGARTIGATDDPYERSRTLPRSPRTARLNLDE